MREKTISFLLLIIAVIHAIPVTGFLGAASLENLYGIRIDTPELEILLRHRAILFGIVATVIALAALKKQYQSLAFAVSIASLAPFFFLLLTSAPYNDAITRIAIGDFVATFCLLAAVCLRYVPSKSTMS